jgi:hypothetical protein
MSKTPVGERRVAELSRTLKKRSGIDSQKVTGCCSRLSREELVSFVRSDCFSYAIQVGRNYAGCALKRVVYH